MFLRAWLASCSGLDSALLARPSQRPPIGDEVLSGSILSKSCLDLTWASSYNYLLMPDMIHLDSKIARWVL